MNCEICLLVNMTNCDWAVIINSIMISIHWPGTAKRKTLLLSTPVAVLFSPSARNIKWGDNASGMMIGTRRPVWKKFEVYVPEDAMILVFQSYVAIVEQLTVLCPPCVYLIFGTGLNLVDIKRPTSKKMLQMSWLQMASGHQQPPWRLNFLLNS